MIDIFMYDYIIDIVVTPLMQHEFLSCVRNMHRCPVK